jgi:hypothetical protein
MDYREQTADLSIRSRKDILILHEICFMPHPCPQAGPLAGVRLVTEIDLEGTDGHDAEALL